VRHLSDCTLSLRAQHVCTAANLATVQDVREALLRGELLRHRNCGIQTLEELRLLAGFPKLHPKTKPRDFAVACALALSHQFDEARDLLNEALATGGDRFDEDLTSRIIACLDDYEN